MPKVKSAEKLLNEHEMETTTTSVTYYSYGVGEIKSEGASCEFCLREGMLNGGMQGCRGYGETKRGGGIQKFPIEAFHKNCK